MIDQLNDNFSHLTTKVKELKKLCENDPTLSDEIDTLLELVSDYWTDSISQYKFDIDEEVESEILSRNLVEKVELNQYLNEHFTTIADPKCTQDDLPDVLLKIWNTRNNLISIDVEFLNRIADELNGDAELYKKIYKLID